MTARCILSCQKVDKAFDVSIDFQAENISVELQNPLFVVRTLAPRRRIPVGIIKNLPNQKRSHKLLKKEDNVASTRGPLPSDICVYAQTGLTIFQDVTINVDRELWVVAIHHRRLFGIMVQ